MSPPQKNSGVVKRPGIDRREWFLIPRLVSQRFLIPPLDFKKHSERIRWAPESLQHFAAADMGKHHKISPLLGWIGPREDRGLVSRAGCSKTLPTGPATACLATVQPTSPPKAWLPVRHSQGVYKVSKGLFISGVEGACPFPRPLRERFLP